MNDWKVGTPYDLESIVVINQTNGILLIPDIDIVLGHNERAELMATNQGDFSLSRDLQKLLRAGDLAIVF
jgi:hypothetical protein